MVALNVQFSDEAKTSVIAYFASPQDPSEWENLGTLRNSDPMWVDYFQSLPEQARVYLPQPV